MDAEPTFSSPYNVPWATFLNTVEKVASDLPNRLDRSYLSSQSGSVQSYLIAAFRGFGLIQEDGTVTDALRELAVNIDRRPALVADLLRQFYAVPVTLGETNATPGELEAAFTESFPRITGASRTKAIRFFLSAIDYAGLPKSPLWKVAKSSPSSPRRPGRPRGQRPSGGDGASGGSSSGATGGGKPKDMKQQYFDLLLKKAESSDGLDADLLDRIERLLKEPGETETTG